MCIRDSDCSYQLTDKLRFRVNIFKQRGHFTIVMRKPQAEIPTLAALGLPPIFHDMAREKNGLKMCIRDRPPLAEILKTDWMRGCMGRCV